MWCLIKSQAKQCKIKVELVGNSYTRLAGEITGPPDTPFEGMLIDNGIFKKTRIIIKYNLFNINDQNNATLHD